jgi:hypothetical protein
MSSFKFSTWFLVKKKVGGGDYSSKNFKNGLSHEQEEVINLYES